MMMMMRGRNDGDNDDEQQYFVGVIIPPADIKTIVDKTAEFVANNGPEFEQKLLQGNDTGKFNFLKTEHPYNAYYKQKVNSFFDELEHQQQSEAHVDNEQHMKDDQDQDQENHTSDKLATTATTPSTTIISKKADVILSSTGTSVRREKPKTDPLKYIYDIPIPSTVTALEYDVIKLTAQYAAANGKQFLTSITLRESRNPLFAFLQPTNKHYKFFAQISAVYSRIVNPELPLDLNAKQQQSEETIIDKLKFLAEPSNKAQVLDLMFQKAEWETIQDQERRKQNDHDASESTAVNAIDWHDFVVVETIDFDEDEEDEELEQERTIEENMEPTPYEQFNYPEHYPYDQSIDMETVDDGDVEMDTTEEHEPTKPLPAKSTTLLLLDDEQELEKRIRKNYVKKDKTAQAGPGGYDPTKFFKDQTTGELIPIDQAEKHMRIKTIDPRWKEQKEREMEKFKTTNIATDVEITDQLMSMVKRRTQNAEQREEPASKPVIWDGHKTSAAYVTQQTATLGTAMPDPQAPSPNLPMYGPTVPTTANIVPQPLAHIQAQAQAAALAATFSHPAPTITPPGLPLIPPPPQAPNSYRPPPPPHMFTPGAGLPPGFIPPPGVPPLVHMPPAPGIHPRPELDPNVLPSSKKQKTG